MSEKRVRELVRAAFRAGNAVMFSTKPRARAQRVRGYLTKKGAKRRNWKKRFFKLDVLTGSLMYFASESSTDILGAIRMDGAEVKLATTYCQIELTPATSQALLDGHTELKPPRTYELRAESEVERDEWLQSLQLAAGSEANAPARQRGVSAAVAQISQRGESFLLRKGKRTNTWNRRWFKLDFVNNALQLLRGQRSWWLAKGRNSASWRTHRACTRRAKEDISAEPHTRSQRAPSTRPQRAATSVKQGAGLADDGGGDADLQFSIHPATAVDGFEARVFQLRAPSEAALQEWLSLLLAFVRSAAQPRARHDTNRLVKKSQGNMLMQRKTTFGSVSWDRRFFRLDTVNGTLNWFHADDPDATLRGSIRLRGAAVHRTTAAQNASAAAAFQIEITPPSIQRHNFEDADKKRDDGGHYVCAPSLSTIARHGLAHFQKQQAIMQYLDPLWTTLLALEIALMDRE